MLETYEATQAPEPCNPESPPDETFVGYAFKWPEARWLPLELEEVDRYIGDRDTIFSDHQGGYTQDIEEAETWPDINSALTWLQKVSRDDDRPYWNTSLTLVRVVERQTVEVAEQTVE